MHDFDRSSISSRPRRRSVLATAFALTLLVAAISGLSIARADSPIEGVWSFNGGQVAITENPQHTFTGTVVQATKFAVCLHPVGEQIWTGITQQPDGSYQGFHQWYLGGTEGIECTPNPELGQTAWRVLSSSPGSSFLRVCFSAPGSDLQPAIPPSGIATNDDAGCSDSSLVSSVPKVDATTATQYVQLPPSAAACLRRRLKVIFKDPVGAPIASIKAYLTSGNVKRLAKVRRNGKRLSATLDLQGLPQPRLKVVVSFRTVLGQKVRRSRTYTTYCRKAKPKLHHHGSPAGR